MLASVIKQPEPDGDRTRATTRSQPRGRQGPLGLHAGQHGRDEAGSTQAGASTTRGAVPARSSRPARGAPAQHRLRIDKPVGMVMRHVTSRAAPDGHHRAQRARSKGGLTRSPRTIDPKVQAGGRGGRLAQAAKNSPMNGQPTTYQAAVIGDRPGRPAGARLLRRRRGTGTDYAGYMTATATACIRRRPLAGLDVQDLHAGRRAEGRTSRSRRPGTASSKRAERHEDQQRRRGRTTPSVTARSSTATWRRRRSSRYNLPFYWIADADRPREGHRGGHERRRRAHVATGRRQGASTSTKTDAIDLDEARLLRQRGRLRPVPRHRRSTTPGRRDDRQRRRPHERALHQDGRAKRDPTTGK